jgi:hypothetical protein
MFVVFVQVEGIEIMHLRREDGWWLSFRCKKLYFGTPL